MKKITLSALLFLPLSWVMGQVTLGFDSLNVNTLKLAVYSDGGLENIQTTDESKSLIYTQHLWLGGYDDNSILHQSFETYRQGLLGFTSGPVSTDPDVFLNYNRVYTVSQQDIATVVNSAGGTVPPSVADWPAHGDTTENEAWLLAPFIDVDNDGVYNPSNGDYPSIKGDVAIYSIFNDSILVANNGLGVEIHAMTYAYNTGTIQDSIVYTDYRIINRSPRNYHDIYLGLFADFDIGNSRDDILGTNINANSVFAYNGDSIDELNFNGFGSRLATAGIRILEGPYADFLDGLDNDRDGCLDGVKDLQGNCVPENLTTGVRERINLSGSMYYFNNASFTGNPSIEEDYYHYLQSRWKDGNQLVIESPSGQYNNSNGDGYISTGSGTPTSFMFPGNTFDTTGSYNPAAPTNWFCAPSNSADQRSLASMGPFSLQSGEQTTLKTAVIWARADSGKIGYDLINKRLENLGQYASNQPPNPFSLNHIVPQKEFNYYYQQEEWFIHNGEKMPLEFNVLNLQGQLINSFKVAAQSNGQIPLASLPHGVYLIQLPGSNQNFKVQK